MRRFGLGRILDEWAKFWGQTRQIRHDFSAWSVLKIEFECFLKIAGSLFCCLAMARNLQTVTPSRIRFTLSPDRAFQFPYHIPVSCRIVAVCRGLTQMVRKSGGAGPGVAVSPKGLSPHVRENLTLAPGPYILEFRFSRPPPLSVRTAVINPNSMTKQ